MTASAVDPDPDLVVARTGDTRARFHLVHASPSLEALRVLVHDPYGAVRVMALCSPTLPADDVTRLYFDRVGQVATPQHGPYDAEHLLEHPNASVEMLTHALTLEHRRLTMVASRHPRTPLGALLASPIGMVEFDVVVARLHGKPWRPCLASLVNLFYVRDRQLPLSRFTALAQRLHALLPPDQVGATLERWYDEEDAVTLGAVELRIHQLDTHPRPDMVLTLLATWEGTWDQLLAAATALDAT